MTLTLRRSLLIIFLAVALVIPLSATTWTWMFYFYEDGTGLDALADFNELEAVGPETDSVNYIILYDADDDSQDGIYYVNKDPNGQSTTLVSRKISTHMNSGLDMDDWETLQTFILWTGANYTADHYGLTVWDHGSGIFKEGEESGNSLSDQSIVKGCCGDIKLWEMRQAVESFYALYGRIDIIGFDVCLLGQIETAYEFNDLADYVIASEKTEPGDGWDYAAFASLSASADYPAADVATDIVDYYGDYYSGIDITQAATSTEMLDSLLVPALNDLADKLSFSAYNYKSNILSVIENSWVSDYNLDHHDLGDFAKKLIAEDALPEYVKTAAQNVLDALAQTVIAEVHELTGDGPTGLKIWIPTQISMSSSEKNHYLYDLTFAETQWDDFLFALENPQSSSPILTVSPTAASFYNPADTLMIHIENAGSDTLHWSCRSTASWLSFADDTSGTQTGDVQAIISENTQGVSRTDTIIVTADSALMSPAYVIITQDHRGAPVFELAPDSLFASLHSGEAVTSSFEISNNGGAELSFSIPEFAARDRVENAYVTNTHRHSVLALPVKGRDPNTGDRVVLGAGGPDNYGYYWIDSDEETGPAFSWTDIASTGSNANITGDDEGKTVSMPFSFSFYGELYDELLVSSNGYITFTPAVDGDHYANVPVGSEDSELANFIAPMWDDLSCHVNGRIYTQEVNGSFIVQFDDLCRTSYEGGGSEHYTFQVVLSPNGHIAMNYLQLDGELTSATIGLEGTEKSDALDIAYNTDYLHDSLSIAIAWAPQFLSLIPVSGEILSGESLTIDVTFNAEGCASGTHEKIVSIASNDPVRPEATLFAAMDVTASSGIAVSADTVSLGDTFRDAEYTALLSLNSTGVDTLIISDVIIYSDAIRSAGEYPLQIAPGRMDFLGLTIKYTENGSFCDSLHILNNSTDSVVTVFVIADVSGAPQLLLAEDTVHHAIRYAEKDTLDIHISNPGEHDLVIDFPSVLAARLAAASTDIPVPTYDVSRAKGVKDPAWKDQTDHAGGPDAFGYVWMDSEAYPGLETSWESISQSGTLLSLSGDDNYLHVDLPFDFPFYGNDQQDIYISTNGRIAFNNDASVSDYGNAAIPTSTQPNRFLAPIWDDLLQGDQGAVYAKYDENENCFIIQFTHWNYWIDLMSNSYGGDLNFQVVLYPNGDIFFRYGVMNGELDQATVGIENGEGDTGLNIVYNGDYLQSNMSVYIAPALPVTVSLDHAVISPGDSLTMQAYINGSALRDDAVSSVYISSNDPFTPSHPLTVDVDLLYPVISLDVDTLHAALKPEMIASADSLALSNTGDDAANITLTLSETAVLIPEPATFDLLPGETRRIGLKESSNYASVSKEEALLSLQISAEHDLVPDMDCAVSVTLFVNAINGLIPEYTTLHPNYPNPFNPVTRLNFDLAEAGDVHIAVFNVRGEQVCRLTEGYREAGQYSLVWSGRDNRGNALPSGIYICRMSVNGMSSFQRMALIK